MSEPAVLESLRKRSDSDSAEFVRCFDRLHTLAQIRFERALSAQELAELLLLRDSIRKSLAAWLEKR